MDPINAQLFGNDFSWGVSTAAFQTEGSPLAGGKSASIWDVFSHKRGKIHGAQNADLACDFYNRYSEDLELLGSLGIPNLRFSIAWSRVLPRGTGRPNPDGVDYYNRVIDRCLELGIRPWVTLYHWDLPQCLEEKGGWTNRDVVSWLADYAGCCAKVFGDRVNDWMVLNEPMVFTGAGYFLGVHAPGKRGIGNFLGAVHHAVLAMGEGGRSIRCERPGAKIGTTFSASYVEPMTVRQKDVDAALRADALLNRLFIEPVLGMGYPMRDATVLRRIEAFMKAGDEDRMAFDFDFIGVQNYTREVVRHSYFTPYVSARLVSAASRKVPLTEMQWEVYPDAIYHILHKFSKYPGVRKLIVTENGAAFPDVVLNGQVYDAKRVDFLKDYLGAVLRAKNEGCPVQGYFVWTLTDNFEWAEGYRPRFGLIRVDFETQQRIVKESGKWYSAFVRQAVPSLVSQE